jgi:hypothetical protein
MCLRIDLIDPEGSVVYKGGMGPFGYKVEELEDFITTHAQPVPPAAGSSTA